MNTVEIFVIVFSYTILDLMVGIGLGVYIAAKRAERRMS